jgi:hypothetical protein
MTRRGVGHAGRLLVLVAWALAACDPRACLAQSDAFGFLRPELIATCCACLAETATNHPEASCSEAVRLPDGGLFVPSEEDEGAANGEGEGEAAPELEDGEGGVPCLCASSEPACYDALVQGKSIVVTGACVDQPDAFVDAPCEGACQGVLTFASPPLAN